LSDRCVHNAHVDDSGVELTLVFHTFDFARDNRSGNGEGEMEHTDFEKPNRRAEKLSGDIKCRNAQSVGKKSEREKASANLAEPS
jgi:hypothetical protein